MILRSSVPQGHLGFLHSKGFSLDIAFFFFFCILCVFLQNNVS